MFVTAVCVLFRLTGEMSKQQKFPRNITCKKVNKKFLSFVLKKKTNDRLRMQKVKPIRKLFPPSSRSHTHPKIKKMTYFSPWLNFTLLRTAGTYGRTGKDALNFLRVKKKPKQTLSFQILIFATGSKGKWHFFFISLFRDSSWFIFIFSQLKKIAIKYT